MIKSIDSFDNNNPQIANNNGVNFFFCFANYSSHGNREFGKNYKKKIIFPSLIMLYNRESIKYIYFFVCLSSGWVIGLGAGWLLLVQID